ncbi:MAG: LytTR family DNA-binding domain-containing protein [Bacteroidales bacterium]|nr:LytTR family DNA-binding domain-containing protein [Bacteroidales bacterium]
MKVIIIEDEKLAADKLEKLLKQLDREISVMARLDSVNKSVQWFNNNPAPDLAFFDIQLADGLSFEIFEKAEVPCPVIFTTAYDEFAIKAFKVNSIDYLLKPVDLEELSASIKKLEKWQNSFHSQQNEKLLYDKMLKMLTNEYKSRFVVKVGEHIRSIPVEETQCFYSMEKATYLQTNTNRHYAIDHTLDQIEALVDPTLFFRINRKYIINLNSIKDIITYTNSRLKVLLENNPENEDLVVSREKVKNFKSWLDR